MTTAATATASSPAGQNALLNLWRNEGARSVIVQIITLAVVFAVVAAIARNIAINLEMIGKDFSFDFLGTTAAYDITFSPFLEYTSRDSHFRAAAVGILNTLFIAACGIVFATILGFTLGILRLSRNWLVNRIAYVFVEFTRNVPILLHILLIHGMIVTLLPAPRGAIDAGGGVFVSNRGLFAPVPVFGDGFGIVLTVLVTTLIGAFVFRHWARGVQERTGRIWPVFRISALVIVGATVLTFLLMGAPITWSIPELKGFNFRGGLSIKPEFLALWFALSYYTACFIAEIVRAGILAVSKHQTEASYALGLRPGRTLRLVVIPQAMRIIIPPLLSQFLNLTKNSSLAIAIGYMDIVATIGGISLMQTGREMETMLIVLLLYLTFSLCISVVMNWFNRRIQFKER